MTLPLLSLRNDPGTETPASKDEIGRTVVPLPKAPPINYDPQPDAETLRRFEACDRRGGFGGSST